MPVVLGVGMVRLLGVVRPVALDAATVCSLGGAWSDLLGLAKVLLIGEVRLALLGAVIARLLDAVKHSLLAVRSGFWKVLGLDYWLPALWVGNLGPTRVCYLDAQ